METDSTRAVVAELHARREELLASHEKDVARKAEHLESAAIYRELSARYESRKKISPSIVPEQKTLFARIVGALKKMRR